MFYGNGHVGCIDDNEMLFLLQLKLTELLQLLTRHSTSWPFLKVFLVFSEVSKNCKILQENIIMILENWQQNTMNEYLRIDKENNLIFFPSQIFLSQIFWSQIFPSQYLQHRSFRQRWAAKDENDGNFRQWLAESAQTTMRLWWETSPWSSLSSPSSSSLSAWSPWSSWFMRKLAY